MLALSRVALRTLSPGRIKRRMGKPPKWLHPSGIAREYQRILRALVYELHVAVAKLLVPQLATLSSQAEALRPRQDSWVDRYHEIQAQLTLSFDLSTKRAKARTAEIAQKTSQFNKGQLNRIARRTIGVDVMMQEPWLQDELAAFSATNADLITSISERYRTRINNTVQQGLRTGIRPESISTQIQGETGITSRRADLIARDQVAKLNGQLTGLRQKELGITSYIWRTAMDERVREEHAAREGETFKWNEPPEGGSPGEDINCRCYAEPVMDDIFE